MSVWGGHATGQDAHGCLGLVDVERGALGDADELLDHAVLRADIGVELVLLSETVERRQMSQLVN